MREKLPARRPTLTVETSWRSHAFSISIGFDYDGRPREMFADAEKPTSDFQAVLADSCIVISIALQFGCTLEELAKSMGSTETYDAGEPVEEPSSPVGHILNAAIQAVAEAHHG
jgi:hypothetical protein